MRKLIFIWFTLVATRVLGQPEWNKGISVAVNATCVYSSFAIDDFGDKNSCILTGMEFNIYGIYAGFSRAKYKTGFKIYEFDETAKTKLFKIGPSFRYKLNDMNKFYVAPYFICARFYVEDGSLQILEGRQVYGRRGHKNGFGTRITYVRKSFEVGAALSNLEASIGMGCYFDAKALFDNCAKTMKLK